jgi:hypothetical protein
MKNREESLRERGKRNQKAKGKWIAPEAKVYPARFLLLPFDICLLLFDFSGLDRHFGHQFCGGGCQPPPHLLLHFTRNATWPK